MAYLQRLKVRPDPAKLSSDDTRYLAQHFDVFGAEVLIDGEIIPWSIIEEIEIAKAARAIGPAGWLVKLFAYGGQDRYHVAFYFGYREAVLPNLTEEGARYVLQLAAYYAPRPVRYTGPEGFSPLTEA